MTQILIDMHVNGLLYFCTNDNCVNHYLKRKAMGVIISLEDFNVNRLPVCFYCFKEMSSELECSVKALKTELHIPVRIAK